MLLCGEQARANVYATNVRINGGITNVTVASGSSVAISYLLNEAASAGMTISIVSGTNAVRTILIPSGAGTLRGTNTIFWDGKDDNTNNVSGLFSISITASSQGYFDWTQISDDLNDGNYVWEPSGLAVNPNANSPYYGRVFVANSSPGPHPGDPGDNVGIQKLNADGSPASEGIFSTGGYSWAGDSFSPWKLEVARDDRVYVNDLTQHGVVISFDQTLSTNSMKAVLRSDNWPNASVKLSGPFLTGAGEKMQIWMADSTAGASGVGIRRWDLGTAGAATTNDLGSTIVQAGAGSDLSVAPYDVAIDTNFTIYTIQNVTATGDAAYRVLHFPVYAGAP